MKRPSPPHLRPPRPRRPVSRHRPFWPRRREPRRAANPLRSEDGITLVEVLVAMLILTVGIVSLISMFDGARKLTLVAERRASITHLAQRELERLQSVPYSELAMVTAPAHEAIPPSATTTEAQQNFIHEHPDYYVDYSSPATCEEVEGGGCFAWNAEKPEEKEEAIALAKAGAGKCATTGAVVEGCGVVSPSPAGIPCSEINPFGACEWTDGRLSGDVYDFVTYHKDGTCAKAECANSYKRVTVVVTVKVPGGRVPAPVRVSTLIPNPTASKENPLASAGTKCTPLSTGKEESCTQGLDKGTARSWFLHDVEAQEVEKASFETAEGNAEAAKGHETHATVGPAPAHPDFMDTTPATRTALYDYSQEQDFLGATYGTIEHGGRRIAADVKCGSEAELATNPPSTTKAKGEMWVTSPISPSYKLSGAGGLTIYTQTIGGAAAASITLCLGVYDVSESLENLWSTAETSPKLIGFASYTSTSWPTKMSSLAFVFKLEFIKGEQTIAEKHRLGFRIWPANEAISIAYDTMSQPAVLQLNTE